MAIYLKNGNYWIDYYAYGKRRREKIGSSKALAENVLRKRKLQIAENKYLDIRKEQKIKFEDFADEYLEIHSKPNNKSWRKSDLMHIRALKGFFFGKYLYEITTLLVEKFKIERAKEVSPATVNRNLSCLKSIFNKAIAWGKASKNPVKQVKFLQGE